jgi:hypothetical protein
MNITPQMIDIGNQNVTNVQLILKIGAKISGTLTDPYGSPVSGARLNAQQTSGIRSAETYDVTNAQGQFSLSRLGPGRYSIIRSTDPRCSSGGGPLAEFTLTAGQHLKDVRIITGETQTALTISRRVTNDTGVPLEGAKIQVHTQSRQQILATTERDGYYTVKNVPHGNHGLSFSHITHTTLSLQGIKAEATGINISLMRNAKLEGQILDANTGEPIQEFSVMLGHVVYSERSVNQFTRLFHEKGRFSLKGASPEDDVFILVKAEGYALAKVPVQGILPGKVR